MAGFALFCVRKGVSEMPHLSCFRRLYGYPAPLALWPRGFTLPLAVFFQLGTPFPEVQQRAYASALIHLLIVLTLSIVSRYLSRKFTKNIIRWLHLKSHISIQDVNAFYGDHQTLRNIKVEISRKQITVILGPSGCGKSTLLKCFNKLIDLTDGASVSGKIIVDGIDVLDGSIDVTNVRRKMGLLPQKPNPLPMSIYDNLNSAII